MEINTLDRLNTDILAGKERETEYLLCCARTKMHPSTAARIRGLAEEELDWPFMLNAARVHGVLPLLYRSVRDVSEAGVPQDVRNALQRAYHRWGMLAQIRIKELENLLKRFRASSVPIMPFKGPVLSAYAYGEATVRKPGDLDLLVHRSDFERAREQLVEAGYTPAVTTENESAYLEKRQGFAFDGESVNVDLHWTLRQPVFDNFPLSFRIASDEIWAEASEMTFRGLRIPIFSNEHLLLYLCAHGAKDFWHRLYLICDIAQIIENHDINWDKLVRQARELHMERILFLGLRLAERLLDAPLPTDVHEQITDTNIPDIEDDYVERLFGPGSTYNKVDNTVTRLQLLDSFTDRLTYLWYRGRRTLFWR